MKKFKAILLGTAMVCATTIGTAPVADAGTVHSGYPTLQECNHWRAVYELHGRYLVGPCYYSAAFDFFYFYTSN